MISMIVHASSQLRLVVIDDDVEMKEEPGLDDLKEGEELKDGQLFDDLEKGDLKGEQARRFEGGGGAEGRAIVRRLGEGGPEGRARAR